MGVVDNIKENVQDILQGAKAVVTGKKTSPFIRKQERLTKEAERIAARPPSDVDPRTTFTPAPTGRIGGSGATSGAEKVARVIAAEKARLAREAAEQARRDAPRLAREAAAKRAEEQRLIEETRRIGRERLARLAQEKAQSDKLIGALRARETIRTEAQERGRAFSKTEVQRRLKQLGTSQSELRRASVASRRQFRKTGVSFTQQIREEEQLKRDVTPTGVEIERVITGEVQPAPDKNFLEKILGIFTKEKTKPPLRKVISSEKVKGGRVESRLLGFEGGVQSTILIFVPDGVGSERPPTEAEEVIFRTKVQKVIEVKRPTGILEGLQFDVDTQRKIIQTRNIRGDRPTGFKDIGEQIFIGGIGAGVATSLLGTAAFIKQAVVDPTGTAIQAREGLTQLSFDVASGKTFRDVALTVKTSPGFALGFVAAEVGTDVGASLALKGFLKRVPKVRLRSLAIQQIGGDDVVVKALGIETPKGRGVVLGSKIDDVVKFGTPDISDVLEKLPESAEIKISSVLETKILEKSLLSSDIATKRAKEIIPPFKQVIRRTLKTKTKFLDIEQLTTATERLPKSGVKVILDIAEEEKGILFGSKARAFQLSKEFDIGGEKFFLEKVPRDIELRFDAASTKRLQDITETAIERLRKLGDITEDGKTFKLSTAREIADSPFTIEAKVEGVFQKVAEFKGDVDLLDPVPEFVAGFKKTGKTMKVGDIKATSLAEELRGVSQGVLRVRKGAEGFLDIIPAEKRLKDIGAVSVTARTLEMSKPSVKLRSSILEIESLFPESLVREQVRKAVLDGEKVPIIDFSQQISGSSFDVIPVSQTVLVSPPSVSDGELISPVTSVSTTTSPTSISPIISISPSLSVSTSPSISPSASVSPSVSISPSASVSPSVSISPSLSISPSISPSISVSPSASSIISPLPKAISKEIRSPRVRDVELFGVEVRRGGVFAPIAVDVSLAEAIKLGQKRTRETLARTFRVRGTGRKRQVVVGDVGFTEPDPRIFRQFEIRKGKRKPTPLQFIQRREFSLGTIGEVEEIQRARRRTARPVRIPTRRKRKKVNIFDGLID